MIFNSELVTKHASDYLKDKEDKEPVLKGCRSKMCFCTGDCKTIIGWRKKNDNPIIML